MKNILTILSLFIFVNFYSQIIHPLDGIETHFMGCNASIVYYDDGGSQGNYNNNVLSQQQFVAPSGGHVIEIDFTPLFDVKSHASGGCEDYIEILDGGSGLMGLYCNENPPGVITSSGNSITVKFYSDGNNEHQGWHATVTSIDIDNPTGSDPAPVSVECIGDVPPSDAAVVTDAADNCGPTSVTFISDASNGLHCPETITRTYRISDVTGNFIDVHQTITVNDLTAPVLGSAPADTALGCKSDMPAMTNLPYDDNCDGDGMVSGSDVSDGNTCPEIVTRTWTYTDACGNIATETQVFTINDVETPTASNPASINVQCLADAPSPDVSVVVDEFDACDTALVVAFVDDSIVGNMAGLAETIIRTYSITDDCGNFATVEQTINLIDTQNPQATSPADLNVECLLDVPLPNILVIADETDNCTTSPVVAFVSDNSDGLFAPETITRTYSVTDEAGNDTIITQTIIINDVTAPGIFDCPSDEVITSSPYDPDNPLFGDNCDLEHIYWTMTGATNSASPTTGIHYIGLEVFHDGITTILYTAADSSGNTSTCSFTVTANLCTLAASAVSSDASCFGASDGSIDVTTVGGAAPISYQWNSGDITEDIMGVEAGTYSLIIIDNNGCDTTFATTVSEPSAIELSINSNDPSCGDEDGIAIVTVLSGGTSPFSYSWTNGSTTSQADSLSAGIYSVQVTDGSGCSVSSNVIINNWNGPSISLTSSQEPSCIGDSDGEIDITTLGGTAPFTFVWSEGSTTEDVSGLISGTYDVTIQDASGCETTESFTVNDPTSIDLSNTNITEASCGGVDGAITVAVSGGEGNYNYQWDGAAGSATVDNVSGLAAGAYTLTVADGNGCIANMTYSVNNVGAPVITEDLIIQPSCTGSGTGSIDVSVTDGTIPYVYSWDSGQVTEDISGLTPGDYQLTILDGAGCEAIYIGTVNGIIPLGEDICLVTVDTLTSTNLVVWAKTDTIGISHYNIYREGNSTGVYDLVGTNPVNVLSQWLDPTANPSIKSWRYKISTVDSCGNESSKSASHKTMHVTSNLGLGGVVNVSWDYYDGFSYGSYYISRYTASTGWVPVDTVVSTSTSWTDTSPPNLIDIEYMIQVQPPSTCTSTKAQDHNTTRSNRHTAIEPNPQGVDESLINLFVLYPNPSSGLITILLTENPVNPWSIRITDLAGKLISHSLEKGVTSHKDLSSFQSGIYLIEINVNGKVKTEKVIIQ